MKQILINYFNINIVIASFFEFLLLFPIQYPFLNLLQLVGSYFQISLCMLLWQYSELFRLTQLQQEPFLSFLTPIFIYIIFLTVQQMTLYCFFNISKLQFYLRLKDNFHISYRNLQILSQLLPLDCHTMLQCSNKILRIYIVNLSVEQQLVDLADGLYRLFRRQNKLRHYLQMYFHLILLFFDQSQSYFSHTNISRFAFIVIGDINSLDGCCCLQSTFHNTTSIIRSLDNCPKIEIFL
ncbi:transmembrane protein, putative (macronuclear) [Tetrahymena thermophila SB210]|uniref:Transmembrane protein, putative n=1 Tax=Tetrahymena thermophila (strain SB210) TaxID=312017 RepID=X1W3W1_TETTS|nr:transmembrane protein, putative [Tetrahymena thermophila SB210]EDK31397.1 transmembrane protein, putative [Tetrahymena thermophila SB210]|eukprot:XP_001470643.1 transmembrane protein, putative [Tetrahymena thermophila SB210]